MKNLLCFEKGLPILVLVLLVRDVQCNPMKSDLSEDISYAELQVLGTSCYPNDFCQGNGNVPSNCDCDSSCSKYNTCCLNSEFRVHSYKSKNNLKCLPVYGSNGLEIFMVDTCNNKETVDNLCFSDPEANNDPFLMVPVTSSMSGVTYKNYFCAACNEDTDSEQLHLWNINVSSEDNMIKNLSEPQFKYDSTMKSWTVFEDEDDANFTPLPVTIHIHQNGEVAVKYCSSDLVENCANNWTDMSVVAKCRAYKAEVIVVRNETRIMYRNPHCALCNFEDVETVRCFKPFLGPPTIGIGHAKPASSVPKTTPLVDIFALKDRQRRCGRNMIYDKFADKCRCNSRTHSKVNGKCVHKI